MEMRLVGMYAEMSCASVSMMGRAVSEPPSRSSPRCVARSKSRE